MNQIGKGVVFLFNNHKTPLFLNGVLLSILD